MAVDDRDQQRAGLVAGVQLIDVRAAVDERLHDVGKALAGSELQRRQAALRADQLVVAIATRGAGDIHPGRRLRTGAVAARAAQHRFFFRRGQREQVDHFRGGLVIGAAREQQLHGVGAIERRREHQRRLAFGGVFRVDVRAVFHQRGDRLRVAGRRGNHQRGGAVGRRRFRIGAGGQQRRHHRGMTALGREIQRRVAAQARRGAQVGAGVDQHLRQVGVAFHGGPMQGGGAVALGLVDVEPLLEQCAHGFGVAVHRGVRDRSLRLDDRRGQDQREADAAEESACRHDLGLRHNRGGLHGIEVERSGAVTKAGSSPGQSPAAMPGARSPSACRRRP